MHSILSNTYNGYSLYRSLLYCKNEKCISDEINTFLLNAVPVESSSIFFLNKLGNFNRTSIKNLYDDKNLKGTLPSENYSLDSQYIKLIRNYRKKYYPSYINRIEYFHKRLNDFDKQFFSILEITIFSKHKGIENILISPIYGSEHLYGFIRLINKYSFNKDNIIPFNKEDLVFTLNISAIVSAILSRYREIKKISTLNQISTSSNQNISFSFNDVCKKIVKNSYSFSIAIINAINISTFELEIMGSSERNNKIMDLKLPLNKGINWKIFTGESDIISDEILKRKDFHFKKWATTRKLKSVICVPIVGKKGINYGTLSVYTKFRYKFSKYDVNYIKCLAKKASEIFEIYKSNDISHNISQLSNLIFNLPMGIENEYFRYAKILEIFEKLFGFKTVISLFITRKKSIGFESFGIQIKNRIPDPKYFPLDSDESQLIFNSKSDIKALEAFKLLIKKKKIVSLSNTHIIPLGSLNMSLFGILLIHNPDMDNLLSVIPNYNVLFYQTIYPNLCDALHSILTLGIQKHLQNKFIDRVKLVDKKIYDFILSISELNEDQIYEKITKIFLEIFKPNIIAFVTPSRNNKNFVLKKLIGAPDDSFPQIIIGDNSFSSKVFRSQKIDVWMSTHQQNTNYCKYIGLEEEVKFEFIIPIVYESETIGMLILSYYNIQRAIKLYSHSLAESIATNVSISLINRKLQNNLDNISMFNYKNVNQTQISNDLARQTSILLDTPITCVWLIKNEGDKIFLQMTGFFGFKEDYPEKFNIDVEEVSITWKTINSKKVFSYGSEIQTPKSLYKHFDFTHKYGLLACLSVPIMHGSNVIGAINSYSRRECKFFDKEIIAMQSLAQNAYLSIKYFEIGKNYKNKLEELISSMPTILRENIAHDVVKLLYQINIIWSKLKDNFKISFFQNPDGKSEIEGMTENLSQITKVVKNIESMSATPKVKDYRFESINKIIETVIFIMEFNAENISIELKNCEEEYKIYCKSVYISRIIYNFLDNSLRALTYKTHIKKKIKISIQKRGNFIEINIFDNGVGIRKELIENGKIFETGFSTTGGTGLGLGICRGIIEDIYKGSLVINSKWGFFTEIIIKLPIDFRNLKG